MSPFPVGFQKESTFREKAARKSGLFVFLLLFPPEIKLEETDKMKTDPIAAAQELCNEIRSEIEARKSQRQPAGEDRAPRTAGLRPAAIQPAMA
jgi:hypothetical protein